MTLSSVGYYCKDLNLTHTTSLEYNSTLNDIISDMKNPKQLLVSIRKKVY